MKGLTKEQAIVLTAITGKMVTKNFADYHDAVEAKLGRPIWTHEFGTKEMSAEIKDAFWCDFMEMMVNSYEA